MSKELKYLSFMGGNSKKARLYDQHRQQLDNRASFIDNAKSHPEIYFDPVLRHHLGLDPLPAKPVPKPANPAVENET